MSNIFLELYYLYYYMNDLVRINEFPICVNTNGAKNTNCVQRNSIGLTSGVKVTKQLEENGFYCVFMLSLLQNLIDTNKKNPILIK